MALKGQLKVLKGTLMYEGDVLSAGDVLDLGLLGVQKLFIVPEAVPEADAPAGRYLQPA